ncbi:MAG: uroporphyrinogen-III C-methyltransferase [Candidatus Methanofastidiosia archaeon]
MTVYLVGAGPGDPDLITVRGLKLIKKADVIIYDRLSNPILLQHAPPTCIKVYVGKSPSNHTLAQEDINSLLVNYGKVHKTVVRLKGGDPFVFGRGGEEAEVLHKEGVKFEVVPGITSAIAGPAYAGIPITHRKYSSSVAIISGHIWESSRICEAYAPFSGTLIILMGAASFNNICTDLLSIGYDPKTPVAAIYKATTPAQITLTGTLATMRSEKIASPSVIVVGNVAKLHDTLSWYEENIISPLKGKKVLLMRTKGQFDSSCKILHILGAHALNGGNISITPLEWDPSMISKADIIIITSANAVPLITKRVSLPKDKTYIAIGPKTKEELHNRGISASVPDNYTSEGLGEYILNHVPKSSKILSLRSIKATDTLQTMLDDYEYTAISVYDATYPKINERAIKDCDIVFVTSSEMARALEGCLNDNVIVVSIGPQTSANLKSIGMLPDVEAVNCTIDGMVSSLLEYIWQR